LGKECIILIFVGNLASVTCFGTAVAHIRSLYKTSALLFFKTGTDLVTLCAGTAVDLADNDLITNVLLLAPKAVYTKVAGIGKRAFVPGVGHTMQAYFLRDGSRILTEESCNVLKGLFFL
jgi:hypothetical protein